MMEIFDDSVVPTLFAPLTAASAQGAGDSPSPLAMVPGSPGAALDEAALSALTATLGAHGAGAGASAADLCFSDLLGIGASGMIGDPLKLDVSADPDPAAAAEAAEVAVISAGLESDELAQWLPARRRAPVAPPPPPVARGSPGATRRSAGRGVGGARVAAGGSDADSDDAAGGSPLPEYTGPLPESYWSLTEWQKASISFKDFTKLMAKSKLTPKQVAEQKKLRRRVKNRYSARQCSERKKTKVASTEGENSSLQDQVAELQLINEALQSQHMLLQERFLEVQKAEAQHVREKLFLSAELDRLNKLVQLANVPDVLSFESTPDFAGAA